MATEKRLLIDLQGVNMDKVDTSDCTDVEDILSAVITYLSEQPIVDAVEVVRCKDCFANGCCSVQIDLDMGDEGYCPKGRKENR